MASGRPKRSYWPIMPVRTGIECFKVKGYDIPSGKNPVWDVGGGDGTAVDGQCGDILGMAEKMDLLPGLHIRAHSGIGDSTQTIYAWE